MQLKDIDAILAAMSDKYEELRKRDDNTLASDFTHISFLIEQAPTIDPVRHGKWKYRKGWGRFVCSVCSFESDSDSVYCPCCGARMDGDSNADVV